MKKLLYNIQMILTFTTVAHLNASEDFEVETEIIITPGQQFVFALRKNLNKLFPLLPYRNTQQNIAQTVNRNTVIFQNIKKLFDELPEQLLDKKRSIQLQKTFTHLEQTLNSIFYQTNRPPFWDAMEYRLKLLGDQAQMIKSNNQFSHHPSPIVASVAQELLKFASKARFQLKELKEERFNQRFLLKESYRKAWSKQFPKSIKQQQPLITQTFIEKPLPEKFDETSINDLD